MICSRHECQTTAGCAHRGPFGEMCYFPKRDLSEFTDDEISREYFWRAEQKLGDPRVGVSMKTEGI